LEKNIIAGMAVFLSRFRPPNVEVGDKFNFLLSFWLVQYSLVNNNKCYIRKGMSLCADRLGALHAPGSGGWTPLHQKQEKGRRAIRFSHQI
jgi:hypothetical protein